MEEAVAALSTFSLEGNQPDIQGLAVTLLTGKNASQSPLDYEDVAAYQLQLTEDSKSINQLNVLVEQGNEMVSILYTYRSCVKALPQLPDSMKQSQADLYLETYQVLDIEIGRLRDIQRWQTTAASKLAGNMQKFCRPERRINGPTVTHMWCILKLLDVLLQLDHLKNAKASIPNDFSWYKRTFTQISTQWPDTDSMREELDDLQIFLSTRWAILLNIQAELFRVNNLEDLLQVLINFCLDALESDHVVLYSERHVLLRVLPVLVVLAISSEKEGDSTFKKIKINRLIRVFRSDPVIPAFPDLHLSPASMLKELSPYFRKVAAQSRLTSLPAPHELAPREALEYQKEYLIIHHMPAIRFAHDEFCLHFAAAINKLQLLKCARNVDEALSTKIKEDVYMAILEGFQCLSEWTGRVWEQCAWKFSRPSKEATPYDEDVSAVVTDYEKVVRCNYSPEERKAMVELISYIKGVGSMLEHVDTQVAETVCEVIHSQLQDFVQNKLSLMLRTSMKKKKELSRIVTEMRTIAADWTNSNGDQEKGSFRKTKDETDRFPITVRATAPTAAQLHCLQFLIHELISGSPKKAAVFFGSNETEIASADMKQLDLFFNKLAFYPYILDYKATIFHVTDLGFIWFREFYLETSRVIQFPIECSFPWMLVDYILESQDAALLESVLVPFDIYNDSAEHALRRLKQRFLYDEVEAEVDLCFDQLVFKLSEHIFSYYKSRASSKQLDATFVASSELQDKFRVFPKRYEPLFQMRRVQILGRDIDLTFLIEQRLNKIFRENLDFLLERFESHDLCTIVELDHLIEILRATHCLLADQLTLDPFNLILEEMMENISMVSFSSRLASQIFSEIQNDVVPNFILCNSSLRLIRSPKACQRVFRRAPVPHADYSFLCGTPDLNMAHAMYTDLFSKFFGLPHMLCIVKLLGSRSLPWLIRALLDHLSQKITSSLDSSVGDLRGAMPKAINLPTPEAGVAGAMKILKEQLQWVTSYEGKVNFIECLKEIGTLLFLMSLLDMAMKETETSQMVQVAPWLGIAPGPNGLQRYAADATDSPFLALFKEAASACAAHPLCLSPSTFVAMGKQAEVTGSLYMKNIQTGSVLEYTLAYLSVVLDSFREKWSSPSKTGLIEITTSKEYHRIYSGIQFVFCGESLAEAGPNFECFGDSVAWGGCAIVYFLGQQQRFELLDFIYHLLSVEEAESAIHHDRSRKPALVYGPSYGQELEDFLDNARRARGLNNHVFSLLRARSPQEDKSASMIKQSGSVVHRVKYPNTPSAFDSLPLKGSRGSKSYNIVKHQQGSARGLSQA
ncbi:protein PIR [Selaginella moellendorffii]|uniref:protein PIR n=1 Tax=Selaginella moellendorffii TaxID=88036 RepID=UPI000D1CCA57|nr:protein PIR [Selaginella moellendorffii]|eukprot:XP_024519238.1 protein PIR [Selaginella moellendorffii]